MCNNIVRGQPSSQSSRDQLCTHDDGIEDSVGEFFIGVQPLQRERVRFQPVEESLLVADSDIWNLCGMDVTIDESRYQELTSAQQSHEVGGHVRGIRIFSHANDLRS